MKWTDSLFKEYGNPVFLLNNLFKSHQFCAWLDAQWENIEEGYMWDVYLHRLPETDQRSFNDFKEDVRRASRNVNDQNMNTETITATIKESKAIFQSFISEE